MPKVSRYEIIATYTSSISCQHWIITVLYFLMEKRFNLLCDIKPLVFHHLYCYLAVKLPLDLGQLGELEMVQDLLSTFAEYLLALSLAHIVGDLAQGYLQLVMLLLCWQVVPP